MQFEADSSKLSSVPIKGTERSWFKELDHNLSGGYGTVDRAVTKEWMRGGRHSSVVSSAPTILRPRVQIPSTPSMLFSVIEIVMGK